MLSGAHFVILLSKCLVVWHKFYNFAYKLYSRVLRMRVRRRVGEISGGV